MERYSHFKRNKLTNFKEGKLLGSDKAKLKKRTQYICITVSRLCMYITDSFKKIKMLKHYV